jgi:hypothetical protein
MRDYSLDTLIEKIHSTKTKEYFEEVIKSYYGESYRSAVVMLYSIAIADLLFKIEELKDIYNDVAANEIINEITELQTRNPTSPDWESKLVELVKEKTNLLEPSDHLHVVTLQKHRHLCAHPIITQNFELYSPNRETTLAHIRNILEGILIKPAFLSRKVFDSILQDLTAIKTIIFDDAQLEKHLNTKFLDRINIKVLKQIFRSIWKIVFKLNNSICEENRDINLRALKIIFKKDYTAQLESIADEPDYFSDIKIDFLPQLIELMNQFPAVYGKLNDSAKILIKNTVSKDADLDTYAVFLSDDISTHIEKVLQISWNSPYERNYITTESISAVFEYALKEGHRDLAYHFLIRMFEKSNQYNVADSRFDNLIRPNLKNFTKDEIRSLVVAVNGNSQIHDRREARSTNREIKQCVAELYENNFDYSRYPNFN